LQEFVQLTDAVASSVDVDEVHMVQEPVEDRGGQDLVAREDLGPVPDVLVARHHDGALLVACAHQTEEEIRLVAVERSRWRTHAPDSCLESRSRARGPGYVAFLGFVASPQLRPRAAVAGKRRAITAHAMTPVRTPP